MAVGDKTTDKHVSDQGTIREFDQLPKLYSGRKVTVEFTIGREFTQSDSQRCDALHLEHGATVDAYVEVVPGIRMSVYADRNLAIKMRSLRNGTLLTVEAVTKFGTYVDWGADGEATTELVYGLLLKRILHKESTPNSDRPSDRQSVVADGAETPPNLVGDPPVASTPLLGNPGESRPVRGRTEPAESCHGPNTRASYGEPAAEPVVTSPAGTPRGPAPGSRRP